MRSAVSAPAQVSIDRIEAHLTQALDLVEEISRSRLSADDSEDLSSLLGAGVYLLGRALDDVRHELERTRLRLVTPPVGPAEQAPPEAPVPAPVALPVSSAPRTSITEPHGPRDGGWDALLGAFETYLLAGGRSFGTARLRLSHLRTLAAEYSDPAQVGRGDLESFMAARRATHKAQTRKSMRSSYMQFFEWCSDAGFLGNDPAAKLAPVRVAATVPRVAPDADVQRALAEGNPRERAIVLLARLGCLRRAEIASLRIEQRDGAMLRVLGKGEKERRVPLDPPLIAALRTIEDGRRDGFYFPGQRGGHIHVDTVFRVIREATGWNPHALRHAGATAGYRATHDLRAVQELLGHASIATTQGYLHVDEDALRAAASGTGRGLDLGREDASSGPAGTSPAAP